MTEKYQKEVTEKMKIRYRLSRLIAFSILLLNVLCIFGMSEVDSLKQKIPEIEGIELLNAYNDLSSSYREIDSEQSLISSNKLLSYLQTSKCPNLDRASLLKYLVQSYYNKGYSLKQQQDYYGGIENFYRALLKTEDQEILAVIYYQIGDSYQKLGQNKEALENYIKGMNILEGGNNQSLYNELLHKKAQVLHKTGDLENSLRDFQSLLANEDNSETTSGNQAGLAEIYMNIGTIHTEMNQPEMALEYFKQALKLADTENELVIQAMICNHIGNLESEAGFKNAAEYYKKALSIIMDSSNEELLASTLNKLAGTFVRYPEESNLTEAIVYAESALMTAEKIKDLKLIADCYLNYSEIYRLHGDNHSRYLMLQKHFAYMDSMRFEENQRSIQKTESLLSHKSRLGQILLSEKTNYQQELQLRKKKSINLILIILMIPLASVSIFLLVSYRAKKRYLRKLKHINQSISSLTTQLGNNVKELDEFKSSLKDQYEQAIAEAKRKNNILIIQSRYVALSDMLENISIQWKLNLSQIRLQVDGVYILYKNGSLVKEDLDKIVRDSMKIIYVMSKKIDDFRDFFRPLNTSSRFNVADVIKGVIEFVEEYYKISNIKIESHELSEELIAEGYPNELALIILNILNNSREAFLQTKPEEPVISISAKEGFNRIMIEIRDNAGGVDPEILPKIFDPFVTSKTDYNASGLGLYIVREIVENRYDGKITLRNADGGVLVKIIF